MPEPSDDENQNEFIDRCMRDEIMVDDLPNTPQRLAVCFRQWDEAHDEENKMKNEMDTRARRGLELENENRDDGGALPKIVGYAAVFGERSEPLPFREVIRPGAFDRSLNEAADVRALINHDAGRIIGRSRAGTLEMITDSRGLRVKIDPPNNAEGQGLVESIRRGDLDGMSFGFRTVADEWSEDGGEQIRELVEVELFDVSVVTWPAYPETAAGLRSMGEWMKEKADPVGDHPRRTAVRLRMASLPTGSASK
jgi:HK97 family phage prohead protease